MSVNTNTDKTCNKEVGQTNCELKIKIRNTEVIAFVHRGNWYFLSVNIQLL